MRPSRGITPWADRAGAEDQRGVSSGLCAIRECDRSRPAGKFCRIQGDSSRRLYLQLVSAEGTLMWKTELLFTIVKGTKDLDEELVTHALLTHVRAHANELGLAELGATAMQAALP